MNRRGIVHEMDWEVIGKEGRKLGKQGTIDHQSRSDHRLQELVVIDELYS